MGINVETWTMSQFKSFQDDATLVLTPSIQRKSVWDEASKMLLIDSLARQVPINAISLYAHEELGYRVFEVIDGKQRLSAFLDYVNDDFLVDQDVIIRMEQDDLAEIGAELAAPLYGRVYSELDKPDRVRLLQYKVPVFVVEGTRLHAVQAFTRMNQRSYALTNQEIRNAVYANSRFLAESDSICTIFASVVEVESGFVQMGVVSEDGYKRMQDIQFASELLALALKGEQHRRDSLDADFYDLYRSPGAIARKNLDDAKKRVVKVLEQIAEIFDYSNLKQFSFPSSCENDFYAIAGALLSRGVFSAPQMKKYQSEIQESLAEFRRQVTLFVAQRRSGEPVDAAVESSPVAVYGNTFLGGQQNSEKRRIKRREILETVLDEIDQAPNQETFGATARALIWARSPDKKCGRCGETVEYSDYHAGHIKAKSLGGTAHYTNGQVEHQTCNLRAGADG